MVRKTLTFAELDTIPYVTETGAVVNTVARERTEQELADKYIQPFHKVLELGGRYGTVSCIINNKIEDPTAHLVVEPDDRVIDSLEKNRDSHNSFFHIFKGIVSAKKYSLTNTERHFGGYGTTCIEDSDSHVVSKTLKELMYETGIEFNCLFADCEGFLEVFFDENKELLASYNLIIYEVDYPQKCNYARIEQQLAEMNFECVEKSQATVPHHVWLKKVST